jgi:hypothetical protein
MLECDAHIYAYQWHLVCLHALSLSFFLYCHHAYESGRSSETMMLGPVLAIIKFLLTFMLFYFQFLNPKNHKTLVIHFALFWICKPASCWCLKTTTSWGYKVVVLLLQVARRVKKRNHLSFPREFDINPESPLWRKLLLLHYSALGVPMSDTLKNRGVPSGMQEKYV